MSLNQNQSLNMLRMDKKVFSVSSLDDESDEQQYWLSKSPTERFYCVEILRQIMYGYDPITTRLQRFFEVTELL